MTHDRTCNGKRHYDHQLNKGTILPLSHLEPYIKVKRLSAGMYVSSLCTILQVFHGWKPFKPFLTAQQILYLLNGCVAVR